jgi:hypothetical protein
VCRQVVGKAAPKPYCYNPRAEDLPAEALRILGFVSALEHVLHWQTIVASSALRKSGICDAGHIT